MRKLLNVDANAKTVKGQKRGYLTGILYLSPADLSGYEVCPQRSAGCTEACLNTAGRGAFSNVQTSRISKTKYYFEDRPAFMDDLVLNIKALERKAKRMNLTPVVRLNGTSDLPWERVPVDGLPNVMVMFPHIKFYDYTKVTKRSIRFASGKDWPSNYHLTFSRSGENDDDVDAVRLGGGNVAAVYSPEAKDDLLIDKPNNVDGDLHDLRFLDPLGSWVLLKAKGPAIHDQSNFVIR